MYEIKKLDVLSTAKVSSGIAVIISIVPFIFFSLTFLGMFAFSGHRNMGDLIGFLIGLVAYPIVSALIGFGAGALIAWLYNLITPRIGGGLKIDLALIKEKEEK